MTSNQKRKKEIKPTLHFIGESTQASLGPLWHNISSLVLYYVSLMNYTQQLTPHYSTRISHSVISNKFLFKAVKKSAGAMGQKDYRMFSHKLGC